jgi:uncharacterized Zn finger protein
MPLPDCMMPDGAEPCKSYTAIYDALTETNAILGALILAQPKRDLIPELQKRYDDNLKIMQTN